MVGDGHRAVGTLLRDAQDEAGVPSGVWKGRGLAALGLTAGDVVSERQAELLLGEGRHPDADRIERELLAQGESPARARRATVLGRPIEHNRSAKTDKAKERTPWLAFDLVFRPPPTAHIVWALMDETYRRVLELCDGIARDKTLGWLEESVVEIRWKAGGKERARVKDGLVVAVFRHYESRATESRPLLHSHAVVSVRARRPHDGKWGNLSADSLLAHIVAADTLYTLHFMEEVTARLGWAWEPREVTPGRRPVMDIAGVPHELIRWTVRRSDQIATCISELEHEYITAVDDDELRLLPAVSGRARAKLERIAAVAVGAVPVRGGVGGHQAGLAFAAACTASGRITSFAPYEGASPRQAPGPAARHENRLPAIRP
nr:MULTISPECIES: MobF family relaxase [unclassified Streptomyces]